jgi:hypothetical protein
LRWLIQGIICLLLAFLLAEYFLGLQIRFRQTRRFIENVKELRRGEGGSGLSGWNKGVSLHGKVEGVLKLE